MADLVLASDAERELCAVRLRDAAAEGRLDVVELEARLAAVFGARTQRDLAELTADLPPPPAVSHGKPRTCSQAPRRRLLASGAAASAALMGLWLGDVGPMRDPVIFGMDDSEVPWPLIPLAVGSGVAAWRRWRSCETSDDRSLTA